MSHESHDFHEARRGGILVAEANDDLRRDIVETLRSGGFNVHEMTNAAELYELLVRANVDARIALPEVFVVGATLLAMEGTDLKNAFAAIGCADSLLVVVSEPWPDEKWECFSDDLPCVRAPISPTLLLDEVSALASPASMSKPRRRGASRAGV